MVARTRLVGADELPAPADLLAQLPHGRRPEDLCAWVRDGQGVVGWGIAGRITTWGRGRFADAQAWWRAFVDRLDVDDEVGVFGSGPLAFGSFSYSAASDAGSCLVVPRVVLGHRDGRWWRTTLSPADSADPGDPGLWQGHVDPPLDPPLDHGEVAFADGALSGPAWREVVAQAVERIGAGTLEKVVLARDLLAIAERPIDPRLLLTRLASGYPRTWVFGVDGMVGATPEMLVRLERGLVTSRVLAGTIRRSGDDEHDLALAGSLARSSKDLEEHEYAVRSVAESLARHCTSMSVPESPFVLHLPNVMHLATDVAGRTRNGDTSVDLAASLHPSAAVCGTPTSTADRLIAELEGMDRGRYAGPVGWMDASGDGEWAIALRSGAMAADDPRRMRIFAGCGIVAGSDPDAELAESEAKLVPMRDALTGLLGA
nr:isochorismate synthase [Kineosphaera limosa]